MLKAQNSIEYILVYAAVFVIAALIVYLVYSSFSSASSLLPAKCTFDFGVDCVGIIEASNQTGTMFAMLGTNMQPYAIKSPSLSISVEGSTSTVNCSPDYVKPGQPMLCVGKLNTYRPLLSYASGTLVVNASYCGLPNNGCATSVNEKFIGNYTTGTKKLVVPKYSLVVTPSSTVSKADNNVSLDVGLNVFGYTLPIASPSLLSSNPSISIISGIAQNTSNGFISYLSSNGTSGQTTITVSYAGLTTNVTIIFIPSEPRLFIANLLSNNLTIVNMSNGVESSVSNLNIPTSIAVSGNQILAYVSEMQNNKIAVVNNTNGVILKTAAVGSYPSALADANGYVYVANSGSGNVTVIDENGNVVKSIKTGIYPNFVVASGNSKYVFVLNQLSDNISIINATTNSIAKTLTLPAIPYAIASNYNGSVVYVTLPNLNEVIALNTSSNSVLWRGPAGFIPFGIAFDQNNGYAYITDAGSSSVSVVNTNSHSLIGSINVGFLPTFATTSFDDNYVYVVNSGSDSVSIINTTTDKVAGAYRTGIFPIWVASQA